MNAMLSSLALSVLGQGSGPVSSAGAPVRAVPQAGVPGTGSTGGLSGAASDLVTSTENFLDNQLIWGNSLHAWIVAGAVAVGSGLLVWVLKAIIAARLKRLAARTTTQLDDLLAEVIGDIRLPLMLLLALCLGTRFLVLPVRADKAVQIIAVTAMGLQLIISSRLVIDFLLQLILKKSVGSDGQPDATVASSLGVLRFICTLGVATLIVMLALDNMGVQVTPLLTGLGIGGIAVALAVQNVLGDLFASMAILLDKPFVVGDSIQVGTFSGSVERIGIKTTRVKAVSGEQLVFANGELLKGCLQNFKRMEERRVAFNLTIDYATRPELLRRIPAIVEAAVSAQKQLRFDRCHLKTFGDWALIFETVYFVKSPDYRLFMDSQQEINLLIIESFRSAGIEMAFPTQVQIEAKPMSALLASGSPAAGSTSTSTAGVVGGATAVSKA